MSSSLKKACAIVGVGETDAGAFPEKTAVDLCVEAIQLALEDAGLTLKDIDGLMTPELRFNPYWTNAPVLAEYLGMEIPVMLTWPWGGLSAPHLVLYSAAMISARLCNTVLLVAGEPVLSGQSKRRQMISLEKGASHPDFELPYGPLIPSMFALVARRHMYEYGTTSEQLAEVAVTFRSHALLHPKAHMRNRGPISIEDVLQSPMISSPLHRLDCGLVSDIGSAIIITSAERARDLKQKPVYLLGCGESHGYMHMSYSRDLAELARAKESAEAAFQMAGVGTKDIDVLSVHDAMTIAVLLQLEALGFCKKGEGGPFVQGGRLAISGDLPTNTHGGQLSHSAGGRGAPLAHIVELAEQLRGRAGARQVKNAKLGLYNYSVSLYAANCTIILAT